MLASLGQGDHGGKIALTASATAASKSGRRRSAPEAACEGATQAHCRERPQPGMVEAALAAFAHEVRTPLTGILAISTLLATSDLDERERRWVDTIKAGAEHLASLATLFVDAARGHGAAAGMRQDLFDLRALARTAGDSLAGRAAAKGLQSPGRYFGGTAGIRGRRCRPAARGAGKPDRQRREIHRTGRRCADGIAAARRRRARSASPLRFRTAASV